MKLLILLTVEFADINLDKIIPASQSIYVGSACNDFTEIKIDLNTNNEPINVMVYNEDDCDNTLFHICMNYTDVKITNEFTIHRIDRKNICIKISNNNISQSTHATGAISIKSINKIFAFFIFICVIVTGVAIVSCFKCCYNRYKEHRVMYAHEFILDNA